MMTTENREILHEALIPFSGVQFDTGLGSGGEQLHFLWDLEEVLTKANWHQIPWGVHSVGILTVNRQLRPLAGSVSAENVEIQLDPIYRQSNLPAAEALIAALNSIGIVAWEAPPTAPNVNTEAIHILIGPKS